MTDKKLEEAATARSLKFWQWPQDSSENIIYQQGFLDGAKWAYENPKQEDGYIFKGYTVQLLDPFGKIYWQATMLPERKE